VATSGDPSGRVVKDDGNVVRTLPASADFIVMLGRRQKVGCCWRRADGTLGSGSKWEVVGRFQVEGASRALRFAIDIQLPLKTGGVGLNLIAKLNSPILKLSFQSGRKNQRGFGWS